MKKKYTVVANWKLNLSWNESLKFLSDHSEELIAYGDSIDLILCPSYPVVYPAVTVFNNTSVQIGGQNCSTFTKGNFTGHVSAQMLHQMNATHCIVGHSEVRSYLGDTPKMVAEKLLHVFDFYMTPILCIGENEEEYGKGNTLDALRRQLTPISEILVSMSHNSRDLSMFLAYEPVWAIGSGKTPDNNHLSSVLSWLADYCQDNFSFIDVHFLYGGSVSHHSARQILSLKHIDGVIVGGASTNMEDFRQLLNNIVE